MSLLQVIFDRSPIQPGKFALIDEKYSLQDCVYVFNVGAFFANSFILERLKKIEKLVINGLDRQEFCLHSTFNKLTHLELREVCVRNPTILKSPNIKTLFLHDAFLNNSREDYFNGLLGFNSLGCKLNHFSNSTVLRAELDFYQSCLKTGAFSELATLDCYVSELKTLLFIGTNFTKLKTINVRIAKSRDDFIDMTRGNDMRQLVNKLRPDLKVNLFGMPLNKSTYEVIDDFIVDFEFSFTCGRVGVLTSLEMTEFEDEHPHLLAGFFKQLDTIRLEDRLPSDVPLHGKFINASEATYSFWMEVRHDLPDRFKAHPNITSLILTSLPDGHYLNDIMDEIPIHFKNLTNLQMDQWDDVNFDFLLQLAKLKTLRLYLRFEFDQSLFIEILRNLKHLSFVEILYGRTDLHTKERLSAFKQSVLACVSSELNYTDCVFKIEMHHRTSYMGNEQFSFVRYILKRTRRDSEENSLSVCENVVRKMMWGIGYKRKHPESSIEHDTMDNIYRKK